MTQSYDKRPNTHRKLQNVKLQHKNATSITQRLRADLGRSVGITTATKLVLLKRFMGSKPSN